MVLSFDFINICRYITCIPTAIYNTMVMENILGHALSESYFNIYHKYANIT